MFLPSSFVSTAAVDRGGGWGGKARGRQRLLFLIILFNCAFVWFCLLLLMSSTELKQRRRTILMSLLSALSRHLNESDFV